MSAVVALDTAAEPHGHAQIAPTFPAELRLTARLGFPLALGELGWMSTYIVDALMVGRMPHSALSIAASSLGNTIFYAIAFCTIGLLTGLQTLTAQAYGRGDERECDCILAQSVWFVAFSIPVVMLGTLAAIPLLPFFQVPPDTIRATATYLHALIWSTAPLLLYWAIRRYLQSLDRVVLITVSLLTGGVVNFAADWVLIYGHLGFRSLGIAGSGWATGVVRLFTLSLLLIAIPREFWNRKRSDFLQMFLPSAVRLRKLFRIGWPSALESLANLGVSTMLSLFCARLGETLMAAHQVTLDLNAVVYMIPLGLSYATSVRVGQSCGRGSELQARRAANASLFLAIAVATVAAALFAVFPRFFGGIYTNDPAVVTAAVPLLLLCIFLMFGDGIGIVTAAALVGVGDTRVPLIVNTTWSWAAGIPLSYWLAFHEGLLVNGLWMGRAAAAVGASISMVIMWRIRASGIRA